jgi:sugar lactone lactonase YvrE
MRRSALLAGVVGAFLLTLVATRVDATPLSLDSGDILVVGEETATIHHYSASGADLGVFAGGLSAPAWVTLDTSGDVWVSEYTGNKVDEFSASGVRLLTISTGYIPGGVSVRNDGSISIADYYNGRVYNYDPSGALIGPVISTGMSRADMTALDAAGNLYVSDFESGEIRRISPTGIDLGDFVKGFVGVEGMVFDAAGNLLAANFNTNTVEKYSPLGADLGVFATTHARPVGLAFDLAGNLYAASGNVEEFSSVGVPLGGFVSDGCIARFGCRGRNARA